MFVAQIRPEVGLDGARPADRAELVLLQHAQQLGLEGWLHLADLVEQDRAAVGQLEQARSLGNGTGEGAAAMAEQLRLDQITRDGGAVDLDERAVRPATELVDRARHELFAGAVLSMDEDAGVARRHLADERDHLLHRLASRDEVAESRVRSELFLQFPVFGGQLILLARLVQLRKQQRHLDRFLDETERAGIHRLDRLRHAAVAGHHDHLRFRIGRLELDQQVEP